MNQVQKEIQLLQGIDTVIVRVRDMATSKEWYTDKLGLKPIWEDPAIGLAVMDTNSPVSLTLWQTDQELKINKDTASYPIFRTPDAEALRNELLSRNIKAGEVVKDDHVTYFFFYDPDGNVLEACQVHG